MTQPTTTEHPPPAPDWILGDDGHWKPPPFGSGGGSRPARATGPNPSGGDTEPDRSTMRGRMGLRRRDIVIGTLGLVIAAVGLVTKIQDVKELIGLAEEVRDPTTLAERACPSTEDVQDILGRPVTAMTSEPFSAQAGGVYVVGDGCQYGAGVSIGAQSLLTEDVESLSVLASPLVVTDPGIGKTSVRVEETFADGEGQVTIVFRTDDLVQGMVQVDIAHAEKAEDLARAVHDRID